MSLILSIETAAEACSAAIHEDGELLSNIELLSNRSSAEMLTTVIEQNLKLIQKEFHDLSAVAVSKGPGSYTGLRIGVSTAKGICYAKDLPLISVNSLDVMISELAAVENAKVLCAMLDARRMEVYCKMVKGEKELLPTSAVVIDENAFQEILEDNQILFFGNGADKCKKVITHKNAFFTKRNCRPKAAAMGLLAHQKFKEAAFEDVVEFEPFYLKEFMGTIPTKNKKVVA